MEETGKTQAQVAAAVGCSQPYISKILSGGPVNLAVANSLFELFGIPQTSWTPRADRESGPIVDPDATIEPGAA
jgi:transcriptional regulator with XRE-family HTH domain